MSEKDLGMKAPFPWFGGKSRVAPQVWARFGDVGGYVEPFAGSLAVLLGRPTISGHETVNDFDCHIANFWRCMRYKPLQTAEFAEWPVTEADLVARHLWCVNRKPALSAQLFGDPHYCDPQAAGYWVWGIAAYIGGGWSSGEGAWVADKNGLLVKGDGTRPGVNRSIPRVIPGGVNTGTVGGLPGIKRWFAALQHRLRRVRVCCGDWSRVLGDSALTQGGTMGIFLDPPYGTDADCCTNVYANNSASVSTDVRKWAIANGENRKLRIALAGYEGEHKMPPSWEVVEWKAVGGYGNQGEGRGKANAAKERIWFSPGCQQRPVRLRK